MRPGAIAEIETCIDKGGEHLLGAYLGRGVDATNGIDNLGGGEEMGGFGRCGSRAVGGGKSSNVDADVGNGLLRDLIVGKDSVQSRLMLIYCLFRK